MFDETRESKMIFDICLIKGLLNYVRQLSSCDGLQPTIDQGHVWIKFHYVKAFFIMKKFQGFSYIVSK